MNIIGAFSRVSCLFFACFLRLRPSDFLGFFVTATDARLNGFILIQSRQFRHQYLVWTNNLQVSNWLHHSSSYEVTLVSPLSQNKRNLFIENSPHWLKQHILSVLLHKSFRLPTSNKIGSVSDFVCIHVHDSSIWYSAI